MTLRNCVRCGNVIGRRPGRPAPWCASCGSLAAGRDKAMYRRALKFDFDAQLIIAAEVFTRDNWVCQLCLEPIPTTSRGTNEIYLGKYDPHAPIVEHTVALAVGGKHTMSNVVTAHQHCNSRKHTKSSLPDAIDEVASEQGVECAVANCARAAYPNLRGWCHTHWYANKEHGHPLAAKCGCGCGTVFKTAPDRKKAAVFLPGHNSRWGAAQTLEQQLATKTVSQPVSELGLSKGLADNCTVWQVKINSRGYGSVAVYADGRKVRGQVHRVVYAHHHGLHMDNLRGMVVDHLCGVRACCNVNHLELVTQAQNLARKGGAVTACPNGHAYTDSTMTNGRKICRLCTLNKTHVPNFGHEYVLDTSSKRARCLTCREGRRV